MSYNIQVDIWDFQYTNFKKSQKVGWCTNLNPEKMSGKHQLVYNSFLYTRVLNKFVPKNLLILHTYRFVPNTQVRTILSPTLTNSPNPPLNVHMGLPRTKKNKKKFVPNKEFSTSGLLSPFNQKFLTPSLMAVELCYEKPSYNDYTTNNYVC